MNTHVRPRLAVSGGAWFRTDPLAGHVDLVPAAGNAPGRLDGYVLREGGGHPGPRSLPAEEEWRLRDPVLREHFAERVFAQARLRELFEGRWRPGDLVAFHSRHKFQILAHDPVRYRETGRIVAYAGVRAPDELRADYQAAFGAAFGVPASRGRHVNALQHVMGPLSERLDQACRDEVVAAIESYRHGRAPLATPIALLRRLAEREEHAYLADQTYLDPFPADLGRI